MSRRGLVVLSAVALLAALVPARAAYAALGKTDVEVTVFTTDPAMGKKVLEELKKLGYTNPENEVLDEPNSDFNIKWGGAPDALIEEIAGVAEKLVGKKLDRQHIFEPNDKDVFINLPSAAAKTEPVKAPAPSTDPQFDADGIPQACGMAEGKETYGSIRKGSKVILGRHRPVDGDDNWVSDMDAFVGQTGTVTSQDGVDGKGCPVVHVDVDKGDWAWRIRDLRMTK
jgi:hypothetical protein